MTHKEAFIKFIAPEIQKLAKLCKEHEIPFIFLAQVDDKTPETACELSLSSDLYYKGVSAKLCEIQDEITERLTQSEIIVSDEEKKQMN